jgi:arylsulfatase A-like enzyme
VGAARALGLSLTVALCACVQTPSPTPPGDSSGAPRPPNVLIIVVARQRTASLRVMPQTKRWFELHGTRFSHAHTATPLEDPATASILTGRYPHNHGVNTNRRAAAARLDTDATLARYLRDAGYRTALFGRFLAGWDVTRSPPQFDDWAVSGARAEVRFNDRGTMRRAPVDPLAFVARRAVAFVARRERLDERPWLAIAAPPVPVARRTAPAIDHSVARITAALDKLGETRDTLAFYLADTGYMRGEHGLTGPGYPYAPSVRIPFLVRWPAGTRPARADGRLVSSIDVAPTVLELAGVVPRDRIDGKSLLERRPRRLLLIEYRGRRSSAAPPWAAVLTTTYKAVSYYGGAADDERAYYRIDRDPRELDDLTSAHAGVGRAAFSTLENARDCRGTAGPEGCP